MSNAVGPYSTTDALKAADAEMTKRLTGPLNNVERAWIVADRKEVRAELAKRAKSNANT